MIILGIDPGLAIVGWGVLECVQGRVRPIAYGAITTPAKTDVESRLLTIQNDLEAIINKLRPFLINDGGNIDFIKFENGIVYIRMLGACANCQMLDFTLQDGICAAIMDEIPEVKNVVNLD